MLWGTAKTGEEFDCCEPEGWLVVWDGEDCNQLVELDLLEQIEYLELMCDGMVVKKCYK